MMSMIDDDGWMVWWWWRWWWVVVVLLYAWCGNVVIIQRRFTAQLGADVEAGAGVPWRTSLLAASHTTEVHGSVRRKYSTTSLRPSAVHRQLTELGVDERTLLD